jgi:hypothetical protein
VTFPTYSQQRQALAATSNSLVQAIVDIVGVIVLAAGFGAAVGLALRQFRKRGGGPSKVIKRPEQTRRESIGSLWAAGRKLHRQDDSERDESSYNLTRLSQRHEDAISVSRGWIGL